MYDLIIVGSGPAGLSAAIYGIRAGLTLLVIEKNPMSGGQILNTYEVDNYLGLPGMNGFDMGMKFREHAENFGVEFKEVEVVGIEDGAEKCVHTTEGDFFAKTLILSTGANYSHLGVKGEAELSGMGVSYCATCDGAFFRGKKVAVVGGGDVAIEDAIYLARFCEKVYVLHRRNEFRAAKVLQEKLLSLENIEILYSHQVKEILGEEHVEKIIIKENNAEKEKELLVDGIFIAVGIKPNTELFRDLISCDQAGYVLAEETGVTNVPGIFVAGDIRKKELRQIITAVADGANAAVCAGNYVNQM